MVVALQRLFSPVQERKEQDGGYAICPISSNTDEPVS